MPTHRPPKPNPNQEQTDRRVAEFALEESRLSNVAYRFELKPRERVWKNWDRTEFEENRYRTLGIAGVVLKRDEIDRAHRTATRALEDIDDILFLVGEPAEAVVVRGLLAAVGPPLYTVPSLTTKIVSPGPSAM